MESFYWPASRHQLRNACACWMQELTRLAQNHFLLRFTRLPIVGQSPSGAPSSLAWAASSSATDSSHHPVLLRIPPPKQTGGGSGNSGSHVAFQFCRQPAQRDPEASFASLATALINSVTPLANGLIILFLGFLHL